MRPFIVIRQFDNASEPAYRQLIRKYAMSFAFNAFLSCLFREIYIQLVVVLVGVMFIFFSFPLQSCALAFPIVAVFLFVSVYGVYFAKSMELMREPITTCWLAEAYEPYLYALNARDSPHDYDVVDESRLQVADLEVNRMKRSIVATLSLDRHRQLHAAGWLHHFAVESRFDSYHIVERLLQRALKEAADQRYSSVEVTATECQQNLREYLTRTGFEIRQVYYQRILANSDFRIMKSQMGIELDKIKLSKDK